MARRILSVLGAKGGIGKSTISSNMLVAARMAGIQAVGIDLDPPQWTLATWSRLRGDQQPAAPVVTGEMATWRASLPEATLVVVDTPPRLPDQRASRAVRDMAVASDIVLVPALPEDLTLIALGPPTRALAEGGAPAVFVLNQVPSRSATLPDVRAYLSGHGEVCPVEIPHLVGINRASGQGLASVEAEEMAGCEAFRALWAFVAKRIGLT